MTASTFVQRFNKGNLRDRAELFIEHDLKEPDVQLTIPAPPGTPLIAFVVNAYTKVGAGVWYAITEDDKRAPISAFRLHPRGIATYAEWSTTMPTKLVKVAKSSKNLFIKAFDGCVLPEYTNN